MTTKRKKNMDYAWLAGFLDGDGCFCIQISKRQRNGRWNIRFNPAITIGLKEPDAWILDAIQKEAECGRCYVSNTGKGHAQARWQTTNLADSIIIARATLPHLRLKRETAEGFLEACDLLIKCKNVHVNRMAGEKVYDLETVLRVARIAVSLNRDRSIKRYRAYRGMDYWEPILREIYS